ncbi:MAG: metallophosphoesterase [Candidatus Peribacteria bacterium]|nr:metallophosphoesterase [Candidatus Peribacteria bacterium]
MTLLEMTIVFFMVRGMLFYVGKRVAFTFSIPLGVWATISSIIAAVGVLISFEYAGKGKRRDYIGIIAMWIFALLMIATVVLALEHLFQHSFFIPGILTVILISFITLRGFLKNRKIIHTHCTIISNKIKKNLKIIFISDIHSDIVYGRRHLKKIVDQIIAEQPDIVLVGGDIVNTPQATYIAAFDEFQRIKAPIYAVTGNHDVYFGPFTKVITEIFQTGNMIPLRNRSIIQNGIQIVGIDDRKLRGKKSLSDVMNSCNIQHQGHFTIFLTHRPIHLSKVKNYPIDLELAGHTHNGQVRGLHFISRMVFDYNYGKYTRKDRTAFISQGLGAGIPFRIGTQGEIVILHLEKKK